MKSFFLTLSLILITTIQIFAQASDVEMATDLRSSGKIYVVVAVVAVIFIGLVIYLFSIDRRLKKLENQD
ncbi:CcmD family protein [Desertivirga brevis]|uniref:CcmD family protein n=1 Tax=Desertivirga brevis TaxID=2810310 RepID=UPI001A956449|nr:CcmD family protein [Pedobacter sp. SYSU D00873]